LPVAIPVLLGFELTHGVGIDDDSDAGITPKAAAAAPPSTEAGPRRVRLDNGIQQSVCFLKELASLCALLLVFQDAWTNALQSPGVKQR
jgi:hypothetical protein